MDLIDPDRPGHRAPHQAAHAADRSGWRGEGMTEQLHGEPAAADTDGLDASNVHSPRPPEDPQTSFRQLHKPAPPGTGVKALRPLRGRAPPEP